MAYKYSKWERFFGLTMNVHPVFNLVGAIGISITNCKKFKLGSNDQWSRYFWIALTVSGVISIIGAYNKSIAIGSFLIPFIYIWLYIVGRWFIKNPVVFLKDILKGTAFMGLLSIIAKLFHINLVINGIEVITRFAGNGRGYILGIGDNGLGVLLQVGVVGSLGMLILNKQHEDKAHYIRYILYFLLSLGGLIITNSRGAMVGTAAGVGFLGLCFSWQVILFFGGIFGLWMVFSSRLLNRVKSIFSLENRSNYIRIQIYKGTLNMIKDHLFFGVGPGNFGQIYEKYRLPTETEHAVSPHSNYLNIISGWGIIGGLLFYGWIFFVMVRSWIRGTNSIQKVILAILISFWVHVFFNDLAAAYAGVLLGLLDNENFEAA